MKADTENCLILGCGPSLKALTGDALKEYKKTHTIFAIKQAYNLAPSLIDYHFLNDNNYIKYDYTFSKAKVIVELPQNHFVSEIAQTADELYFVNNTSFENSLSYTHDFDRWTIKNSLLRPWGPGIMYELVLYYAFNMGFRNIHTVGWDLGPPGSKTRDHFYSHSVQNPASPLGDEEANREIELTGAFYMWLKTNSVNLTTTGGYSHQDIPRL